MTRGRTTAGTSTAGTSTARTTPAGLTWQLLLQATPAQVFDALHRAAIDDGRCRASDERDRRLLFSGVPGGPGERTSLCAYVREHDHGTLLQFGPPEGRTRRAHHTRSESAELAEVAEAASIGSLVHRMRGYLDAVPAQMPIS